jgi:hypothetical protein
MFLETSPFNKLQKIKFFITAAVNISFLTSNFTISLM